jgi:hypothetical protein
VSELLEEVIEELVKRELVELEITVHLVSLL